VATSLKKIVPVHPANNDRRLAEATPRRLLAAQARGSSRDAGARHRPKLRPPGHGSPEPDLTAQEREIEGEGEEGEKGRPDAEARTPPPRALRRRPWPR